MKANNLGRKSHLLRYEGFLNLVLTNSEVRRLLTEKHKLSLVFLGIALKLKEADVLNENVRYEGLLKMVLTNLQALKLTQKKKLILVFLGIARQQLWLRIKNGDFDSELSKLDRNNPHLKKLLPDSCKFKKRYGQKRERSLAEALKECKYSPYRFRELIEVLAKKLTQKISLTFDSTESDSCCGPSRAEAILALCPLPGVFEILHEKHLSCYEKTCAGVRAQISALFYYLFLRGPLLRGKEGCDRYKLNLPFDEKYFLKSCGCLKKVSKKVSGAEKAIDWRTGTYALWVELTTTYVRVLAVCKNQKGQVCFGTDGYLLEVYAHNKDDPGGEKLASPDLCALFPGWYAAVDKCLEPLPSHAVLYPKSGAYDLDLIREYHTNLLFCLLKGKTGNSSAK